MLLLATILLISTIEPHINTTAFAIAMAGIGIGMGLLASQLANAVQSAVTDSDRSEAGGLQYTAQQLGAALGTALIGAVLITGLITAFSSNVEDNPAVSADVSKQIGVRLEGQVSFVDSDQVRAAASDAGLDTATTDAIVASYSDAQLQALKTALLAAGFIVVAGFFSTGTLPTRPFDETAASESEAEPAVAAPPGR